LVTVTEALFGVPGYARVTVDELGTSPPDVPPTFESVTVIVKVVVPLVTVNVAGLG
jgi:hypothetical protein